MPFDMSNLIKQSRKIKAGKKVARRTALVLAIVDVIREDWREGITPTLLNHEGALIASLRSGLCLTGMGWKEANQAAQEVVAEAFRKAGAHRPTWKEGQPEWTDGGVIRDSRTSCANCGKGLDVGQKTYCSKTCFDAHRARLYRAENLEKMRAIERIRRARRNAQ